MHLFSLISSSLFLAAAVQAQTAGQVKVHVVDVGKNGSLTFSPDNLKVNPGEMVQFHFWPKVIPSKKSSSSNLTHLN